MPILGASAGHRRWIDILRAQLLEGFSFSQYRRGASAFSPIVCLAHGLVPADPLEASRLALVKFTDDCQLALAAAPEAARAPNGIAYATASRGIADRLVGFLQAAGAVPAGGVA
jgi:hypothetical protein